MYFLMFWIMSASGFSKYARYQILLRKTYFINILFPNSESCKCPHFHISSQGFFSHLLPVLFRIMVQFCMALCP